MFSVTDKCDVKWDEISDCRSNLAKDNTCTTKHGKVTCVAMYKQDDGNTGSKVHAENLTLEATKHCSKLCNYLLLLFFVSPRFVPGVSWKERK